MTEVRAAVTDAERRHDVWLAAALLVGAVVSAWLGQVAGFYDGDGPGLGWALGYAAALTLPVAFRRRHPATTLVVVSAVFFAGVTARIPDLYVGNIVLFIAVYTVGAWVDDRRRAVAVRVAVIAAMFVWLVVVTFVAATGTAGDDDLSRAGAFSPFAAFALIQFLVNGVFFGGAYFFGDRAHAGALALADLEERTRELERERALTAAQAVALDRLAIARELHDVVAHHVSAMGVQAGAARTVLGRDPDAARGALSEVERSAREALTELRGLLGTLRAPGADPAPSTLRLEGVAVLVEHAADHGLPAALTVVGDPVTLPDLVEVNLFRVAQEALTNARRHGGSDAAADVRVRWTERAVELEIANSGAVRPDVATGSGPGPAPGLGIVGMRERMSAVGGTLTAGPRPRGGFVVRARVPLDVASGSTGSG